MARETEQFGIELICVIANYGQGSKLVKSARHHGISGGTVMLGKGTIDNQILSYIGLSEMKKELVYMAAEQSKAYRALEEMNKEFEFRKPNHGIAFTTSICGVLGTKSISCENKTNKREKNETMYHAITTIVEKGKAEEVIEAATKAGSKGGTIINGRGSGIHETSKLFSMDIEPEKEIVLILSEAEMTQAIVSSIGERLKINEPGNGIIYVQDVNKTYGLYK